MMKNLVINHLFTKNSFRKLISKNGENILLLTAKNCGIEWEGRQNEDVIGDIYKYVSQKYRNEYYYKNVLLNKLVFGIHKPTTTSALTEITVGDAKADFILVNGKAIVYEIKTELDNLERLNNQIHEYYKAFRYVTVATYKKNYDTVLNHLTNTNVGVCVITQEGRIDKKHGRMPSEYLEDLDAKTIFHILRKKEFEEIINQNIGDLPKCSAFDYYSNCFDLINRKMDLITFQSQMEREIKKRPKVDVSNIASIPDELKNIAYFSEYNAEDYRKLKAFLNAKAERKPKEAIQCISHF